MLPVCGIGRVCSVHASFEEHLLEIVKLSLGSTPEDMLEKALDTCIQLSGARGGSILAEEGPYLQFVFADVPELIGSRVPFDSIAGACLRRDVVVYTYAPTDARHFAGVDEQIHRETKYLLSVPIPSVHMSADPDRPSTGAGALQLLFEENIFPEMDVDSGPREFSVREFKEQEFHRAQLKNVFWALPLVALGMEVIKLRRTSYQAVHELKNKLIGGQSWLGCLHDDLRSRDAALFEDATIKEDFELCEQSVREGSSLAKTYLQLASIYAPKFEPVNVNEILNGTGATIRGFAEKGGVPGLEVVLELDDAIPVRELDAGQLKMAFFNLCKNAVEAMGDSGTTAPCLTITSALEDGRIKVKVGDNGPGMPDEIAENLFVAFKTKKEGGTGLGLTIMKKIVDVHGGNVTVATGPEGTRFEITL